ncbi:MAG TPA: peptidylprolyl isomerase [Acidimicrobiales bacterium]|nr:peptidylprolyl isomerase [Acidimicrobiales bacterium]
MRRLLLVLVAVAVSLGAACGAVSPYAVIVNGERVPQRTLDRELKAIRGNKAFVEALNSQGGLNIQGTAKNTFDMAFVSRVLTRRIFYTLIHQQLVKRKIKITAAQLTAARRDTEQQFGGAEIMGGFPKGYVDDAVRTTAEISAVQASLGRGAATPEKIKEYYDAHQADYQETCVSHILVDTEEKAKELKAQIDKGGDFAELAKKESKDNQGATGGSAAKGGSLDCITGAQAAGFVPEFVAGYKDLAVGKVSDPVKTQFGYHLIKVTDRRQQSLADATEDITAKLGQDTQDAFQQLISDSARKAKVRVNPRYGRFDSDQLTIIPPTAPPAAGTATTAGLPGFTPAPGG